MNKKVSTILTLSLMLGGSLLSSSAFAKDITFPLGDGFDAVSNGSEVIFAQSPQIPHQKSEVPALHFSGEAVFLPAHGRR